MFNNPAFHAKTIAWRAMVGLSMLILSGCVPPNAMNLRTTVAAFAEPSVIFTGKSFFITAADKMKADRLESQFYGNLAAGHLTAKGMVRSQDPEKADLLVLFDYSIDDGKSVTYEYPVFIPGQSFTSTSFGSATAFGKGGTVTATGSATTFGTTSGSVGTETGAMTVYTRRFSVAIYGRAEDGRRRSYELRATSQGSSNDFAAVAEPLIESALEDFPGQIGKAVVKEKVDWHPAGSQSKEKEPDQGQGH
jgi:hypothetical protein